MISPLKNICHCNHEVLSYICHWVMFVPKFNKSMQYLVISMSLEKNKNSPAD